jgi:hypothetical protein
MKGRERKKYVLRILHIWQIILTGLVFGEIAKVDISQIRRCLYAKKHPEGVDTSQQMGNLPLETVPR